MKKSKSFWIKLTAIIVVVALVLGTGLFLWFSHPTTLTIASRGEIIALWDEQGITRWFENTLNVRIRWIDYGEEPFNRVVEDTGREPRDLPDAYLGLGLSRDEISTITTMDPLHFLNFERMLERAPNLQGIINSDIDRMPQFRIDGSVISFPAFYERFSETFPQKAWVNREWQQRAQLSMPRTPEEFLAMLRAFAELNDGSPPLAVAYGASPGSMTTLGFLVQAFVTTDYDLSERGNYLNVRDGMIYAGVTEPGFRDALEFLNQIYSEGLVDSTLFTQGAEIFLGGGRGDERYGVIFANDLYALFHDADRAAGFDPLPPLGNNGHRSTLARQTDIVLGGFMIPSRIGPARQHLAMRFGDAMLSRDGTLTVLYGNENIGWSEAEPGALAMGADTATWQRSEGEFDGTVFYAQFFGQVPFWFDGSRQMERQAPQAGMSLQNSANWQGYLNSVTLREYAPVGSHNLQNILPELVLTPAEEVGLNRGEIIGYLTRASREFVTGARSIDADWDDFVDTLNELGLQDIINAMQGALNR